MTNKSELKSYNKHTWKYSPSVGIPELQAALRFRLKKSSSFFSLSSSPSSLIRHLLFLSFTSSSNSFKTSPQLSKISSHGSCNSLLQLPLFFFFFLSRPFLHSSHLLSAPLTSQLAATTSLIFGSSGA